MMGFSARLGWAVLGLVIAALAAGCSGDDSASSTLGIGATCELGSVVSCDCGNGPGHHVCRTGVVDHCACGPAPGTTLPAGTGGGLSLGGGGLTPNAGGIPGTGGTSIGVATGGVNAGTGAVTTGSPATGGAPADDGGGGAPVVNVGGPEPRMPAVQGTCPTMTDGQHEFLGYKVQLWVGTPRQDKKAPLMFYWHGTGSSPNEAVSGLGSALTEIVADGGVVAAFVDSTGEGQTTGTIWYPADFRIADEVLACALQQFNIDTRRIYSAGCSAGGLQTGHMVFERSSYLAAAMPNSGGIVPFRVNLVPHEDPGHVAAVMSTHGGAGDTVGVNFGECSAALNGRVTSVGGLAIDCNHGGAHCISPPAVRAAQWQFLKDHPYGVSGDPYGGTVPPSFPSFCEVQ